jgi:tRNA(Arg) A34 adenosine deaminase TadA
LSVVARDWNTDRHGDIMGKEKYARFASDSGHTQSDPAMTHHDLLRRAIELAEGHSAGGRNGPFGAVVARAGKVLGEGWNRVVETHDPTAHAEILAIRDACQKAGRHHLHDCVIYCSTEPCPMCLAAIYWARIPLVLFACSRHDAEAAGFDDSLIYDEVPRAWEERHVEGRQLLREEGLRVLESWAENPDRWEY